MSIRRWAERLQRTTRRSPGHQEGSSPQSDRWVAVNTPDETLYAVAAVFAGLAAAATSASGRFEAGDGARRPRAACTSKVVASQGSQRDV